MDNRKKIRSQSFCFLAILGLVAAGSRASAATTDPFVLTFDNLVTGAGPIGFSFPAFDRSLGTLQSVSIGWDFSGTIVGSASGASQSASINSTITHWVFFDFRDFSDGFDMVEPTLSLTASIPAQNTTIAFGPTFQSTVFSFDVTSGDLRFDAWGNGPRSISGSLNVLFTNTTEGFSGLEFFPGDDSGVYSGSLSLAYNYEVVPEPSNLTFAVVGLLLLWSKKSTRGPTTACSG